MNASLAALLVGYAPRLRVAAVTLALAALLASACALPVGSKAHASGPPHCADLIARAFSSPNAPVPGAFACLSPRVQDNFRQGGVSDDATFAQYAASDPVFTAYRYVGRSTSPVANPVFYYFELTPERCLDLQVDAHGLIDGGGFASDPGQPCPSPLP